MLRQHPCPGDRQRQSAAGPRGRPGAEGQGKRRPPLAYVMPPPLVGGGKGAGLAPAARTTPAVKPGKPILRRAAARSPLPQPPAHRGGGMDESVIAPEIRRPSL